MKTLDVSSHTYQTDLMIPELADAEVASKIAAVFLKEHSEGQGRSKGGS